MNITASAELPIIPVADEAHPSVIACRVVLRQREAEIERLLVALNSIIEEPQTWKMRKIAKDAVQQSAEAGK